MIAIKLDRPVLEKVLIKLRYHQDDIQILVAVMAISEALELQRPSLKACEYCGRHYRVGHHGKVPKYCSNVCRNKAHREKRSNG